MAMAGAKQIFNINQNFQFSKLAVKTNNVMPLSTINVIKKFYSNNLRGIKILLFGIKIFIGAEILPLTGYISTSLKFLNKYDKASLENLK